MPCHRGIRLLLGGNCAPALITSVQPRNRSVGPEHSVAALRPFNLFNFFQVGDTGSLTPLYLLALSYGRMGKEPGRRGKKTGGLIRVRRVKNSAVLGLRCVSGKQGSGIPPGSE
jgi:hypothetical protein